MLTRDVDELFDWCMDIEKELDVKQHSPIDSNDILPELEKAKVTS